MRLLLSFFPFIVHFTLFLGTLYALGEGRFGLVTLLLCASGLTLIYHFISPKHTYQLRLGNLVRFIPFFLYHSFLGALGVAKLILKRHIALSPHYHTLPLHGTPATNAITANIFSLMPGTLSVEIRPASLTLHILDISLFDEALIRQTHQKLEALFSPARRGF
ncbi:MAG: Na+/H+ antiporter subunit E [Campylobacterales bacterium]|nr:Na+/H+ antiporter subunit E [Campylobacterales bacterium]